MNNEEQKIEETKKDEPSELEKAKQERDEYLNGWKRAKADLINYQKDESKRLRDAMSYGAENAMRDLILVLDSFNLGIAAMERGAPAGGVDKGIYIIKNQLEETLKRHGLEKMKVSPGDAFDPNLHESLGEMEDKNPSGSIAAEVEAGYTLHGKVIRAARVKLSK